MDILEPKVYATNRRERIYSAFKRTTYTQDQLALASGIHRQIVNDILKGRRPGKNATPALAKALGVSARWIDHGEDPPLWIGDEFYDLIAPQAEATAEDWRKFAISCLTEAIHRWEEARPIFDGHARGLNLLRAAFDLLHGDGKALSAAQVSETLNCMERCGIQPRDFGAPFLAAFPTSPEPHAAQTTPHSPDQIDYDDGLEDLVHQVRDIIGRQSDKNSGELHPTNPKRGKRHHASRRFAVTAIPGAYEFASHVALTISGTPSVGMTIVPLTHSIEAFDLIAHRAHSRANVEVLRRFILKIAGTTNLAMVPWDFRWEMGFEDWYRQRGIGLPEYHRRNMKKADPVGSGA